MHPSALFRVCLTWLILACLLSAGISAQAADPVDPKLEPVDQAYLREHYTKYEYEIPMRDGVKLFTAVYSPKDLDHPYPLLLKRTPYGIRPYGVDLFSSPDGPMKYYAREKFIFVFQDVRGRNASGGVFEHVRPQLAPGAQGIDESTDTYDTIDWLVKRVPNNNGRVGMLGISYPGFYAAAGMIRNHPALKAVSPQAPIADWFIGDDFRHNGVFYLAHAFRFMGAFGQKLENPTREDSKPFDFKTPDGYEFYLNLGPLANADARHFKGGIEFWRELMDHSTYDSFWQARNILPHLKDVKTAVLTVGGWFDAEDLYGPLNVYRQVEKNNPGIFNSLVIGPWSHGGWARMDGDRLGSVRFKSKTSEFFRERIELPFLKRFLKSDAKDFPGFPKAWVFETGTDQWRQYDQWPPAAAKPKTFLLGAGDRLTPDPALAGGEGFDEYVSDPAKPVPYIPNIAVGMTKEHMLEDQRFASSRPDVLVYRTGVLDRDVTLAGPVEVDLRVSTTGTDSDWVVKLIDVYPGDYPNPEPNPENVQMGGYQQLIRGEAMRGKFRKGFDTPIAFEPGKPDQVRYTMPDVYHTFRRGHRIMIHVQSSWFPLVDRNPQTFCDIYKAGEADFRKATQRIYRGGGSGSRIVVRELDVSGR